MAAVQDLYHFLDVDIKEFSKGEILILEVELFIRVYEELREFIREKNKDYFRLMKFDIERENKMIEANFIRCIINDILSTEEYSLTGIACYTDTPEEVIYEVATGCNVRPTFSLGRKIIDLHRSVRPRLYREIMGKIAKSETLES